MRIEKITVFKASVPLTESFRIALGVVESSQLLFVKIDTSEGTYGMGEAAPYWAVTGETLNICEAAAVDLAKMLLGKNPLEIAENLGAMNRYLAFNTAIKSAFDMALYDIAGKLAGMPIYQLLGGSNRPLKTDLTIGIDSPEKMAQKAVSIKNDGFSAIKVKLGEGLVPDLERIRRIREAIGPDIMIRVDANQGWDYPTAVTLLRKLEPYDLEYCEQPLPVWDHENMKRLRENSITPLAADESVFDDRDAFKLASNGCCDILNIKLAKSGGIHTAVKIDTIAQSAGLPCMLGCMIETRLSLTAAAHLASAHPNIQYLDLDGYFLLTQDPVTGGASWDGEDITLPEEPGLGADLEEDFLNSCEQQTIS
ncbi:MAG: dipeptide epimerase [Deltaproteobacteria bacterium]|nr:dipeptide epimerase [Deltaproteobacteria bacterium]